MIWIAHALIIAGMLVLTISSFWSAEIKRKKRLRAMGQPYLPGYKRDPAWMNKTEVQR